MIGKPVSILNANASSITDVKANALTLNGQITKALKIDEVDAWFRDLKDAWVGLLIASGFAVLLAIIYVIFLACMTQFTIWASFVLVIIGSGLGGYLMFAKWQDINNGKV